MPVTGEPIEVGVLFSQSGVTAVVESTQRRAALLAIDEINESGGLLGRELVAIDIDPRSDPRRFGHEAERLMRAGVETVFGCYMSSTRRAVLPIIERNDALLFYPTLYEGFEFSPYCVYSGAAPNQNSMVLSDFLMRTYGDRYYFVGSNYVFPYESNRIMRDLITNRGGTVLEERYIPLDPNAGAIRQIVAEIGRLQPSVVFSTVVGEAAVALYKAYQKAGFDPGQMPIASLTMGEPEMAATGSAAAAGHITSAPYFSSIASDVNDRFVTAYRHRYGADAPISACCEAAYFQVHLYAEAVRRGGSTSRRAILNALPGIEIDAPQGPVRVDGRTQHTFLTPRVARATAAGTFSLVYEARGPLRPDPYMIEPTETHWGRGAALQ